MSKRPDKTIHEVIIIGAGPAGLAAAGALQSINVPFLVLEQEDDLAHSWRNHYDRLHLHTVKQHSALPHLPFPKHVGRYPSRAEVVAYLESYAEHFGIAPQFGQMVIAARRRADMWEVKTENDRFLAQSLIIATGYNNEPVIPDFPGLFDFSGSVLHSSIYKNGKTFAGKNVLVVGSGNSGAEIAIDLHEHGAKPWLVVRSPIHVIPRDVLGSPTQVTSILFSYLPIWLADTISNLMMRLVVGDLSRYGIRRPEIGPNRQIAEQGRIPMLDIGTVDLIKQGKIQVAPGVKSVSEGEVTFVGGSSLPFDAIILATGYRAGLDRFLEDADMLTDMRGYPRWHGRESAIPGLFFLGFRNPSTGMLREINIEARRIAHVIASRSMLSI